MIPDTAPVCVVSRRGDDGKFREIRRFAPCRKADQPTRQERRDGIRPPAPAIDTPFEVQALDAR